MSENLRGKPYNLSGEEIKRRVREAWERGASEVCMQGGIHPHYTGETYLEIVKMVKEAFQTYICMPFRHLKFGRERLQIKSQ